VLEVVGACWQASNVLLRVVGPDSCAHIVLADVHNCAQLSLCLQPFPRLPPPPHPPHTPHTLHTPAAGWSRLALARVSVLRGSGPRRGVALLDDHIRCVEPVVDYLTRFSGIHPGEATGVGGGGEGVGWGGWGGCVWKGGGRS
jgi:hypothetical protein